MEGIEQIEESVKKEIKNNPDYEKELERLSNKFFFYSSGGWISEESLLKKVVPSYCKKEHIPGERQKLQTVLVALLATNRAIQKIESDGVPRFKFTENADIHLEFLHQELSHLNSRRDFILRKIKQFEEIKKAKK